MEIYKVVETVKKHPIRTAVLIFIISMQVRAYFTQVFIWPFSHQTVMYSGPVKFPFERLYIEDAITKENLDTTLLVQRPFKLTFLYLKLSMPNKSYQKYLELLVMNKDDFKERKIFLKKETVHKFRLLCEEVSEDTQTVACLDRGLPCR